MPSEEDLLRHGVAGSPRDVRDDDSRVPEQSVHQGGLADVGGSGNHNCDAALQPRDDLCIREQLLDLCMCFCCKSRSGMQGAGLVLPRKLLGEVDGSLHRRERSRDQAQYPAKGLRSVCEQ